MLYQELPSLESTPLHGWGRWLAPVLIVAVALTVVVLMVLVGQPVIAIVALGLGAAVAGVAALRSSKPVPADRPLSAGPDFALVGSALGLSGDPCALTSSEGALLIANAALSQSLRFGPTAGAGQRC